MTSTTWLAQQPVPGRRFDVCNGDADGLCAVRQWRLHEPQPSTLITGLKREIDLLARVPISAAHEVLVCDLSMRRNRAALERLLAAGVAVRYFDHHAAGGPIPIHRGLAAEVEESGDTCTSLLVDRFLQGRFRAWALVGAYGDNLAPVADVLAAQSGLGSEARRQLRRLGEAINYNAYGESLADVCVAPAQMYALMCRHAQPLDLLAHDAVQTIERQRDDDLRRAADIAPRLDEAQACVTILPDAAWSRRVVGALANERANAHPRQAQAVLRPRADGRFRRQRARAVARRPRRGRVVRKLRRLGPGPRRWHRPLACARVGPLRRQLRRDVAASEGVTMALGTHMFDHHFPIGC